MVAPRQTLLQSSRRADVNQAARRPPGATRRSHLFATMSRIPTSIKCKSSDCSQLTVYSDSQTVMWTVKRALRSQDFRLCIVTVHTHTQFLHSVYRGIRRYSTEESRVKRVREVQINNHVKTFAVFNSQLNSTVHPSPAAPCAVNQLTVEQELI